MNLLEQLKELRDNATSGPWNGYPNPCVVRAADGRLDVADCRVSKKRSHNGRFIVAMENALPDLLALAEACAEDKAAYNHEDHMKAVEKIATALSRLQQEGT